MSIPIMNQTSGAGRTMTRHGANRPRFGLALSILIAACCVGCVDLKQPPGKTSFYTIEYDAPVPDGRKTLPVNICVNRFNVVPSYNTQKIVYREKPFMSNAYIYSRWGANPGDFLTYFLGRDFSTSGLFNAAFAARHQGVCSYVVEGVVEEFFELDEKETWTAVASIGVTLVRADDPDVARRIVFQKRYSQKEPCKRKHPRALAAAMSLAVSRISNAVMEDIHAHLKGADDQPD